MHNNHSLEELLAYYEERRKRGQIGVWLVQNPKTAQWKTWGSKKIANYRDCPKSLKKGDEKQNTVILVMSFLNN